VPLLQRLAPLYPGSHADFPPPSNVIDVEVGAAARDHAVRKE
jgi:hypothetical protein